MGEPAVQPHLQVHEVHDAALLELALPEPHRARLRPDIRAHTRTSVAGMGGRSVYQASFARGSSGLQLPGVELRVISLLKVNRAGVGERPQRYRCALRQKLGAMGATFVHFVRGPEPLRQPQDRFVGQHSRPWRQLQSKSDL